MIVPILIKYLTNSYIQMSFEEINAAEELMKLAINNQSHVNSLIGYYRDLIDAFND